MIEIQDVTVFRQQTRVLENFSLQIKAGEKVALLGPNGAGKSTLLKLICRELYPVVKSDSFVRLYGSERAPIWELRSQLGLVSADLQDDYTPYTRALDVVVSGFFGSIGRHDHLQPEPQQIETAQRLLETVGMAEQAEQMYQRLSTGQKRRLLLARALVHEPDALILDEPASGLDMGASVQMLQLMRSFCQAGGSMLIATHHIDEIIPEIERVVLLQNGKILADGPKAEVLTGANLSSLYNTELAVTERNGWYRVWHE